MAVTQIDLRRPIRRREFAALTAVLALGIPSWSAAASVTRLTGVASTQIWRADADWVNHQTMRVGGEDLLRALGGWPA